MMNKYPMISINGWRILACRFASYYYTEEKRRIMTELAEKIYKQALDLPINDRLVLIDRLHISTNSPTQDDIDQAWSREVERRCRELDGGKAKLIPGEEVFDKIKKRFVK